MERRFSEEHQYDDIMNLPYRKSTKRPWMSQLDRAAQFSPFAALTGLDDTMDETARLTEERIELDEEAKTQLDEKLRQILAQAGNNSVVRICYFQPDQFKNGGAYFSTEGHVKKVDPYTRKVTMSDGSRIPMDDILEIEQVD